MKLETLYKRAKTGKVVYWSIEVCPGEGNITTGPPTIVKRAGELWTDKPKVHVEEVPEGKQKRTPVQQAEFQAQSDWKKKRDEGYKSLEDLGIAGDAGDKYSNLEHALEETLPQFNTDASGNVKPMLAKAVNWEKVVYPCYIQPKLDGVRCLMIVSGNNKVVFLSRSGKEYTTLDHIGKGLTIGSDLVPDEFILDGEIYSEELSFQEISAAVKKQRDTTWKLKFRAYDIVNDESQDNRIITVTNTVKAIGSPYVTVVPTLQSANKEHVMEYHNHWVLEGYEGVMIRLKQGTYAQGQRSSDLLKVKEFIEEEFAFKNFEFGQRGVEDLIAVLWDGTGTKEFRAKMAGTKAHKEALYEEYKDGSGEGKPMTIKYFELTDDKLPRFPVGKGFRED